MSRARVAQRASTRRRRVSSTHGGIAIARRPQPSPRLAHPRRHERRSHLPRDASGRRAMLAALAPEVIERRTEPTREEQVRDQVAPPLHDPLGHLSGEHVPIPHLVGPSEMLRRLGHEEEGQRLVQHTPSTRRPRRASWPTPRTYGARSRVGPRRARSPPARRPRGVAGTRRTGRRVGGRIDRDAQAPRRPPRRRSRCLPRARARRRPAANAPPRDPSARRIAPAVRTPRIGPSPGPPADPSIGVEQPRKLAIEPSSREGPARSRRSRSACRRRTRRTRSTRSRRDRAPAVVRSPP